MKTFSMSSIDAVIEARAGDFVRSIRKTFTNDTASYIDALVDYAEKNGIEMETLGEIVKNTPALLADVTEEAEALNILPKTVRLDC